MSAGLGTAGTEGNEDNDSGVSPGTTAPEEVATCWRRRLSCCRRRLSGSVDGILRLLNTPEVPREPSKERTAASEGNAKGHGGSGASGRLLPVHTQRGEGKMIHAPQSRVTASRILTTPTKGLRTACAFAYGVVAHSRRLCSLDTQHGKYVIYLKRIRKLSKTNSRRYSQLGINMRGRLNVLRLPFRERLRRRRRERRPQRHWGTQ